MNVRDYIDPEITTMRWSRMRLFQATTHNSIFNPFDSVTDEVQYLEVVSSVPEYYERGFLYEHNFQIDPKMQQMATVRLSFWTALSDLGGFHDGIYVLVKAFIAPVAASLF